MARFKSLDLRDWRQFANIQIDFHPRLTILTGANGAGKSTILYLLAHFFGWQVPFVAEPRIRKGVIEYFTSLFSARLTDQPEVGRVLLDSDGPFLLQVPSQGGPTYNLRVNPNISPIPGIFIPSHRPVFTFSQVTSIPPAPRKREEMAQMYKAITQSRYISAGHTLAPSYALKENLIALAIYGYGNPAVSAIPEARKAFEDFDEILRKLLPKSLGFEGLEIRSPDVVLKTSSGTFSIDAVSGGVASIIDIAWQIYLTGAAEEQFIVVIDEPENHLHPELQADMLPSLLDAFPKLQFICATHSPLIITSVADSIAYALRYDDSRRVFSTRLDFIDKAGSADDVLREVLGLATVTPAWVTRRLDEAVRQFSEEELTDETLMRFKSRLQELGLAKYIPESLNQLDRTTDR